MVTQSRISEIRWITTILILSIFALVSIEKRSGAETMNELNLITKALAGISQKAIGSSQLLVVVNSDSSSFKAKLYAYEKVDEDWEIVSGPIDAAIGKNGFALPDQKMEGDHRSPTGLFPLERTFGYGASYPTKMPWLQMTEDDIWVDDSSSPDYNRLVKKGATQAASFEKMKRTDQLYKFGIVIEYNTKLIVKGKGSAIFIHLLRGPDKPTAGCAAIDEKTMKDLLAWLDPAKKPIILMGPEAYLKTF